MNKIIALLFLVITVSAFAGGRNDQVKYPAGYQDTFIHYHTQNRANNKQLARLYANQTATDSSKHGVLADGSIVIMEIHKPKVGADGKPVAGEDGLFLRDKLAAVAVMEKRSDWGADYPADQRAGGWGFALYDTQGQPKENDLECQVCHQPLTKTDFMFSFSRLSELH